MKLIDRIHHKLIKIRLQPIRVFCFHHVSNTFDESTMKKGDWLQTEKFKQAIEKLRGEGYVFVSLAEANEKLIHDVFRWRKYAVLTADDGWASICNILPWLNEQQIPITLFLNPAYLDGKHFRERETEQYLNETEVEQLYLHYPLVTIGSHGWMHVETITQTEEEFACSVKRSVDWLKGLNNYVPFFAFPYGRCKRNQRWVIKKKDLVPILLSGNPNYHDNEIIDRELLK